MANTELCARLNDAYVTGTDDYQITEQERSDLGLSYVQRVYVESAMDSFRISDREVGWLRRNGVNEQIIGCLQNLDRESLYAQRRQWVFDRTKWLAENVVDRWRYDTQTRIAMIEELEKLNTPFDSAVERGSWPTIRAMTVPALTEIAGISTSDHFSGVAEAPFISLFFGGLGMLSQVLFPEDDKVIIAAAKVLMNFDNCDTKDQLPLSTLIPVFADALDNPDVKVRKEALWDLYDVAVWAGFRNTFATDKTEEMSVMFAAGTALLKGLGKEDTRETVAKIFERLGPHLLPAVAAALSDKNKYEDIYSQLTDLYYSIISDSDYSSTWGRVWIL